MSNTFPTETPNVRIENPKTRKVVGDVLGWAGVAVTAAVIVDTAIPAIDLAFITVPAGQIVLGFLGLFQTLVTSANVPDYSTPDPEPRN